MSGDPLEGGITSTDYSDATAENGTTYYYQVTAVSGKEEDDGSDEVEVTSFSEPPTRP